MKRIFSIGLCIILLSSFVSPDTDYETGLISCYTFDSDADDESGINTNDGTVAFATNQGTNCASNNCYDFDGDDDWIKIPADSSLVPSTGLTLAFWVYPRDITNEQVLLRQWNTGTMWNVPIRGDTDDSVRPNVYDSVPASGAGAVSINTLLHVTMTANLTTKNITIYYDGVSVASKIDSTMLSTTGDDVYLGIFSDTTRIRDLDGNLDEVGIWGRELSQDEITGLYDLDSLCPFESTTSTCDCSSIQAGTPIDCSENCNIETCNANDINLVFEGSGKINLIGDLTVDSIAVNRSCEFNNEIGDGNILSIKNN